MTNKGIGIAPDDQQHLFRRFFRVRDVTNVAGTGLLRRRVFDPLLRLSEQQPDGLIQLSRADLAAMVGTATELLIRSLSEFKMGFDIAENNPLGTSQTYCRIQPGALIAIKPKQA